MVRPRKKSVDLRVMPDDVFDEILDCQTYFQKRCKCRFSKEKTIIAIIRRWRFIKNYRVGDGTTMQKIYEELNSSGVTA